MKGQEERKRGEMMETGERVAREARRPRYLRAPGPEIAALGAAVHSGAPGGQVFEGRRARRLVSRWVRAVLSTSPANNPGLAQVTPQSPATSVGSREGSRSRLSRSGAGQQRSGPGLIVPGSRTQGPAGRPAAPSPARARLGLTSSCRRSEWRRLTRVPCVSL